jgi:hypothetical protein
VCVCVCVRVCLLVPEYEKATSEKEIRGGDMFPASANLNLNIGSVRGREDRRFRGKQSLEKEEGRQRKKGKCDNKGNRTDEEEGERKKV